jgi:hypothetical protein
MWDIADGTEGLVPEGNPEEDVWATANMERIDREIEATKQAYEMIGRLTLWLRQSSDSFGSLLLTTLEEEVQKPEVHVERMELVTKLSRQWWRQQAVAF